MKYQIGDKIIVLHSNEEGEVIDIINDKMVMIDVRGVKFPAYMDQIDFPYYKRFTEKKLFPPKKERKYIEDVRKEKPQPVQRVVDGVWLSFLPRFEMDEFGDDVVTDLKVHLINRTETAYYFIYYLQFFGTAEFELKAEIHPFMDFYLHDIPFEDINDSPTFVFEFSLLKPEKSKADYYESSLKLKPKQLFDRIEELKQKGEATFTYNLFENYPNKPYEETFELPKKGAKIYSLKEIRQHLQPARTVVDLHIEKLTDNWKKLSNGEIMNMQLKEFDKWYELAVAHRQSQLIIIHGVGSGKLRDEIHDILRRKKEVKSFVNQYHPNFGYGATEIFFQY